MRCLALLEISIKEQEWYETWSTEGDILDLLSILNCVDIDHVLVFFGVLDVLSLDVD